MPTLISPGYPGSRYFSGLSQSASLPLDQVNFLLGQLVALTAAFLFRLRLGPERGVSPAVRHVTAATLGVCIMAFCYGKDTVHMVNQAWLCYAVIRLAPVHSVHRLCLLVAMGYLSILHIWRLLEPRQYIDISGPVMVLTMKVTLLAYNIHDGSPHCSVDLRNKPALQRIAISEPPSLVEYLGYVFNFQTVVVGPMIDFWQYKQFIHNGLRPVPALEKQSGADDINDNRRLVTPCPSRAVLWKMTSATVTAFCVVYLVPKFPQSFFRDERYHSWSVGARWCYLFVAGLMARMKYYTAWVLADAVCNASGLGFNGLNADGTQRWDAVSNVVIWKVEFSENFRELLENWNISTGRWLRLVAYERARRYPTVLVYVLSAVWHGFHPGYYVTFSIGALCTTAAREGRRCLRHYFQGSAAGRALYDLTGRVATRLAIAYLQLPFVLLDLRTSLRVYQGLYFAVHVICVLMIVALPRLLPPRRKPTSSEPTSNGLHNGIVSSNGVLTNGTGKLTNGTSKLANGANGHHIHDKVKPAVTAADRKIS